MAQSPAGTSRPCVLLIDDSKFVRTTFSSILKQDFEVREEADGEAGWNAIASDPSVVIVFCDISMPRMDGFGVLSHIRGSKDERVRHLPVIMISGNEDEATRKRARDSGASEFISKTADATEILSRLDTLLHLVRAKEDVSETRKAAAQTATHDPLTGTFTLHYLLTEGRKYYSYARRHGQPLSVVSFRIDSHLRMASEAGKEAADQVLARIAKVIQGALRAEDSMGRVADDTFTVIMAGTSAEQANGFARRLQDQLGSAQVNFRGQALKIQAGIGLASLGTDAAASVEELMRLASNRMGQAGAKPAAPAVPAPAGPAPAAGLPPEVERSLQVLERIALYRTDELAHEVLGRLLPLLQAACRRLHVELPLAAIMHALQNRPK